MGGDAQHASISSPRDGVETWPDLAKAEVARRARRPHWRPPRRDGRRCVDLADRRSVQARPRRRPAASRLCRPPAPPASISWPRSARDVAILAPGARAGADRPRPRSCRRASKAQVRPRSGLAVQAWRHRAQRARHHRRDYRGEVKVMLINLGAEPFTVTRGMRIAQIVIAPVARVALERGRCARRHARGAGGFGSTGPERGAGLRRTAMQLLSRRSHARPSRRWSTSPPRAARAGRGQGTRRRHAVPPRHLETLLQALVRAGILKGVRGPRGGYRAGPRAPPHHRRRHRARRDAASDRRGGPARCRVALVDQVVGPRSPAPPTPFSRSSTRSPSRISAGDADKRAVFGGAGRRRFHDLRRSELAFPTRRQI